MAVLKDGEVTMVRSKRELKKVSDLTQKDFELHPIWSWAEAMDEDLVTPVGDDRVLEEDHDALFVACLFILNDGTSVNGELSVRATDHWVFLLSFPEPDGSFFSHSLHPNRLKGDTPTRLAEFFGKTVDQVFPLAYETPFVWPNGEPLRGKIQDM